MERHILLASKDSQTISRLHRIISEKLSANFIHASSFEESLKLISTHKCSIVIVDNDLYDDQTCIDFLHEIKNVWEHIIRVLLVGDKQDDLFNIVNRGEIYRVISKSWDSDHIESLFHEVIDHFNAQISVEEISNKVFSQNKELNEMNNMLEEKIVSTTEELYKMNNKLALSFIATVQALTHAVEAKDVLTCGHSDRVAKTCMDIGMALKMDADELEGLYLSAKLHDIGKIGISDTILLKPEKLTHDEIAIIRQHPVIGYKILGPIPFEWNVAEAALQHHERHDGKGYPHGLQGNEISVWAKIIAVADSYDAMTWYRPYSRVLSHQYAVEEIVRNAGTQFDPEIVKVFAEIPCTT